MADLSITAANVAAVAGATIRNGLSGVASTTLQAGKAVYLDRADNLWKLADANLAGANKAQGIALNAASLNQPLAVLVGGQINLGATLMPGQAYFLSATAGGICPYADLTSGCYANLIGIAASASILDVSIVNGLTPIP